MKKLIILDTFTQNVIEVSVSEEAYKSFVFITLNFNWWV